MIPKLSAYGGLICSRSQFSVALVFGLHPEPHLLQLTLTFKASNPSEKNCHCLRSIRLWAVFCGDYERSLQGRRANQARVRAGRAQADVRIREARWFRLHSISGLGFRQVLGALNLESQQFRRVFIVTWLSNIV